MNHSISILEHIDKSSIGAEDIVEGARSVTNRAVPALQLALNQSAHMIERLEKLAQHPVLQLSLTQGVVSPPGR